MRGLLVEAVLLLDSKTKLLVFPLPFDPKLMLGWLIKCFVVVVVVVSLELLFVFPFSVLFSWETLLGTVELVTRLLMGLLVYMGKLDMLLF